MPEVLAVLRPSAPRRLVGVGAAFGLGLFLVWIGFARPPEALVWKLFVPGFGILMLWLADAMRRATGLQLELSREELRDSSGRIVARVADIAAIDRGAFAVKPSSGFRLRLAKAGKAAWAPGLWWRIGRNVGVGGMTGGNEGKYMAEVISEMLAERRP